MIFPLEKSIDSLQIAGELVAYTPHEMPPAKIHPVKENMNSGALKPIILTDSKGSNPSLIKDFAVLILY